MMNPVDFPESNTKLTPPAGMTEEECGVLPVYRHDGFCLSCWELTSDELMELLQTKRIWVWVYSGETQPPVALSAGNPFKATPERTDNV